MYHTLVKIQTVPLHCVFHLSSINGYQLMNGHVCVYGLPHMGGTLEGI